MADIPKNNTENNTHIRSVASLRAARRRRLSMESNQARADESGDSRQSRRIPQGSGNTESGREFKERFKVNTSIIVAAPYPGFPKFGATSVCGRRRDMEDAVSTHPSFYQGENQNSSATTGIHYFGVYDGHGCSHVASRCEDFLHELVKEEMLNDNMRGVGLKWEEEMKRSFKRMDEEATTLETNVSFNGDTPCRCLLQSPAFDAVGSAVIVAIITPTQIIISNCGDCRAVLCQNSTPIPLSFDHKPDRPDELERIQAAGGHVISWDGPRVEGVLAMSRAIGDTYLKPFVSCEPEVIILDRTDDDEHLILASDGLWDVISNETACSIVHTCFTLEEGPRRAVAVGDHIYDRTCFKASTLLTMLAMSRDSSDNISVVIVDLKKN